MMKIVLTLIAVVTLASAESKLFNLLYLYLVIQWVLNRFFTVLTCLRLVLMNYGLRISLIRSADEVGEDETENVTVGGFDYVVWQIYPKNHYMSSWQKSPLCKLESSLSSIVNFVDSVILKSCLQMCSAQTVVLWEHGSHRAQCKSIPSAFY